MSGRTPRDLSPGITTDPKRSPHFWLSAAGVLYADNAECESSQRWTKHTCIAAPGKGSISPRPPPPAPLPHLPPAYTHTHAISPYTAADSAPRPFGIKPQTQTSPLPRSCSLVRRTDAVDATHDARAAVRFLRKMAADPAWRLDPDRIGIGGGSAGAVTALFYGYAAAAASEGDSGSPGFSSAVSFVMPVSGELRYDAFCQGGLDPRTGEPLGCHYGRCVRSSHSSARARDLPKWLS